MNQSLVQARKNAGMSQQQLADLAGVDRSTYAHYERGKRPTLGRAVRIAKALNKSVEDLFMAVVNEHKEKTGTTGD
ncbi:MAG: helix-turn-helix transcriptional regulator [Thermoplasmatales archaeon]